jgi:hypothetical protein
MAFAPEGTFTVLERDRAVSAGRKGGRSRSRNKGAAARRNGQNGGRTSKRTLLERILNRKVTPGEWPAIRDKVLDHILEREKQHVTSFFKAHWTEVPHVSWRQVPPHVRQAIRHVKAAVAIFLPSPRKPKWVAPSFAVIPKGSHEWTRWFLDDLRRRERAEERNSPAQAATRAILGKSTPRGYRRRRKKP